MAVAKKQGRSEEQSEDFRQNKQHSWLSPICIGQAQVEEKTQKNRSQSVFSLTHSLSRVRALFLSLSPHRPHLSRAPPLSSSLWVGMPSRFEDGFSCYLLNKMEL